MDENCGEVHVKVQEMHPKPLQDASNRICKLMPSSAELEKRYIDAKRRPEQRQELLSISSNSDVNSRRHGRSQKELTVPRGPVLHTSWRPRSTDKGRRESQSLGRSTPVGTPRSRNTPRTPRLEAPSFEMSSPRSTCRAGFLNMTPESVRSGRSTTRSVRSMRSARSGSNISVDSQASRSSSLCSRLSSLDLEEMAAEEGRRRLKSQLRRNAKSYQQAINNPDMRRGHHSLKLTVPEEFHLSVNRSERGHRSCQERPSWLNSLRPTTDAGKWTMELTVPLGPQLNTSRRSCSRDRDSRRRSVSCKRMPQREQDAIERHLQRTRSQVKAPMPIDVKVQLTEEDQRWIQDASSAKVRAARARTAMQKRSEEAYNKQKEKLFVFGSSSKA